MHHTESASGPLRDEAQRHARRLAWATLLLFFSVFLVLVGWAVYAGRQFYLAATNPREATVTVHGSADSAEWVSWQPAGRSIFQGVSGEQTIGQGDAVRVVTKAGYNKIASISLFDQSQLDLWAGADIRIETMQTTRWSDRLQEVTFRQSAGYVRYDLRDRQPYQEVAFRVLVGDTTLTLTPGGSYSIELLPTERRLQAATPGTTIQPFVADIAVRSGSLTIHDAGGTDVALHVRQRVEVDQRGIVGLPVPALWDLIRDGGFSQFTEAQYNNTTQNDVQAPNKSTTWQVYSGPALPLAQQGFFRLSRICRPPATDNDCATADRRTAAWFYRAGGQTSGFTTGIKQQLGRTGNGVDISEFRKLKLALWVRVIDQSLEDVGDRGSECPVMIRVLARKASPDDPDQERVVCIYSDANDKPPRVKADDVLYYQVPKGQWTPFEFNLRDQVWLKDYSYLQGIQIYANGHDYNSLVAEVSLIGEQ